LAGKQRKSRKSRARRKEEEEAAALRRSYLSDPIALMEDGEYEALDRLYAEGGAFGDFVRLSSVPSEPGPTEPEPDDLPF
jgi:hypothetical protein